MAMFRGHIAMISPWVEPGDFYKFIVAFPDTDRMGLCLQVANGLAYLHEKGVVRNDHDHSTATTSNFSNLSEQVYGDLKAQNVLIGSDAVVKLTDFGLSILEHSKIAFSATETGGGTSRWMAPELIKESAGRSVEADVYALGMKSYTTTDIYREWLNYRSQVLLTNYLFAVITEGITPARPERLTMHSPRHEKWWELLQKCWNRESGARPKARDWETLDRGFAGNNPDSAGLSPTIHSPRPNDIYNMDKTTVLETNEGGQDSFGGLNDGTYEIYNVRHGNKAIVPLNAFHEDLVGSSQDELEGAKVCRA
ncbi:hypothetical protein FRC10_002857 [Ceratobasidium sp. 414]|nr:hypothetical protein FRC10_002857 [Ceratobasidium sp. 414]